MENERKSEKVDNERVDILVVHSSGFCCQQISEIISSFKSVVQTVYIKVPFVDGI